MKNEFRFDSKYLKYLALLSFLSLSQKEIESLKQKLEETRKYIKNINKIDTKKFKPTYHTFDLKNVVFEDGTVNKRKLNKEDIFKNSTKHNNTYFVTKKII